MAKIHHIFGGIPESELEAMAAAGAITPRGKELLHEMGVEVESNVVIRDSTLLFLIKQYNFMKTPPIELPADLRFLKIYRIPVTPEEDYLWERIAKFQKAKKFGITIGAFFFNP